MKRISLVLCVLLALLLIGMTACSGAAPTKDIGSDSDDTEATQKATDQPSETTAPQDTAEPDNESDYQNTDATVAGAYSRYLESKSVAYDTLSAMIESNDTLSITAALALLPVAMIDLAAIPISLIQGNDTSAIQAAAGMLGFTDISIENTGDHFKLTYKTDEGTVVWEGDYDAATDSVTCEMRVGDELSMIVEFVKGDAGYASQYYSRNEDGSFSLIRFISEGEDMAIGLSNSVSGKPDSIFKNHPGSFDFVKDCDSYFTVVDGKGEAVMDGEKTEFGS